MDAKATWHQRLSFTGTADSGFEVPLGVIKEQGGDDDGLRPMELLLIGLAGCTAMDAISIMQKKKQDVVDFEVLVHTRSAEEHPHVWEWVQIEYVVTGRDIDPKAVERAMQLSSEKYCPAQNMLNKAVDIELTYRIINAD